MPENTSPTTFTHALLLLLLVLPLFTTTLGCATTVGWLLLAFRVTKEGRSLC